VCRGAYRLVGSGSSETDELAAVWKLTAPARFTHERTRTSDWDGIVVGGTTAAAMLDIGDFYLSPYRVYAPRRINSRNPVREVRREGHRACPTSHSSMATPVTRPERTISDLVTDGEDPSTVSDALRDAVPSDTAASTSTSESLLCDRYGVEKAGRVYRRPAADAGLVGGEGDEI